MFLEGICSKKIFIAVHFQSKKINEKGISCFILSFFFTISSNTFFKRFAVSFGPPPKKKFQSSKGRKIFQGVPMQKLRGFLENSFLTYHHFYLFQVKGMYNRSDVFLYSQWFRVFCCSCCKTLKSNELRGNTSKNWVGHIFCFLVY